MNLRSETEKYLSTAERFAGKKFRYRLEIGLLLDFAERGGIAPDFEKLIFLAKFITRGFDILRRSGIVADETKNLSDEVQKNLEQVTVLLRKLCAVDPAESSALFGDRFFSLSHESMMTIQELLSELTWIKYYSLEGNQIPITSSSPK
jgi:hypothetical protein